MSGEGTVFNFSLKSPLSLELHKKLMKINTVKLENKDVHVTLASGTVEHVYVNLEKIQPPNKLVMILSFGLGFLGIGGSVSVMIYLGTRMVGSPSRSEDSNHLLEAQINDDECDESDLFLDPDHTEPDINHDYIQMDEEEDDESDVFLGPAQPKPVPQISIISQRGYERKENGKSSNQGETDYCAEPVFTIVQPPHTPPVVTGTPPVVSGTQADVVMSGVLHSTKSTNLSVQRH